ncbi:MAG: NADH:flavin oxidoreductase/NADH oxidase [Sulfurospirillaceae bacterium]|nr:NADH:flavin oxidoreductase/NADH oxidase [Sulfurospirillaceae bacterium]
MKQLLSSYQLGHVPLKNRVVMPPMCMYKAKEDGCISDFHMCHYGARAIGGVGLIIVEATAVEACGRITDNDLGLWDDKQIAGHQKLNNILHDLGSKTAIQLAHAGRKSLCKESTPVAPSALLFSESGGFKKPHALDINEIEAIKTAFVKAAQRALKAGYDILELHSAHGYLLCEFLSPLTNQRNDLYGGSLENRCRLTLEICEAILHTINAPLLVRISADEWMDKGWNIEDSIYLSHKLKDLGVAMAHVSAGGNHAVQTLMPELKALYQSDYAKKITDSVAIPTIAVGMITTASEGETLLETKTCDLVAYGRELLRNPNFVHHIAKAYDCKEQIEVSYLRAY